MEGIRMRKLKAFVNKKYWLALCIAFLVMLFASNTVMAETSDGIITFLYKVSGVEFRLYKVGQVDALGNVVFADEFQDCNVNLEDENAAQTLKHFIDRDNIAYLATATTDDNFVVKFENLSSEGDIYLICGEEKKEGDIKYIPTPTLVTLPTEKDGLQYNEIVVVNKIEIKKVKNLSVLITWKDSGVENKRPSSITIQLLKNGVVEEEVILGPENNWAYEWKDLDSNFEWTVVEKVTPPEYGFSIRKEGDTYVVVHDRAPVTSPSPPSTENTTEGSLPSTSTPSSGGIINDDLLVETEQLPQTGQLWWPVIVLVFGGLLCLVVGLIFKRTERE